MITTYQIRNVLRIYGNQLKKKSLPIQDSVGESKQSSEVIDISMNARKKQMLNKISKNMIAQVTSKEDQKHTEENNTSTKLLPNSDVERNQNEN